MHTHVTELVSFLSLLLVRAPGAIGECLLIVEKVILTLACGAVERPPWAPSVCVPLSLRISFFSLIKLTQAIYFYFTLAAV